MRIALLSNLTTDQLAQMLELQLFSFGAAAEIYRPEYGTMRQEIMDPGSGLYEFRPQFVFLATGWRDLVHLPDLADEPAALDAKLQAEFAGWSQMWQTLHGRLGCQIIQNNFDSPAWRLLDNYEMTHPAGLAHHIQRLNADLHRQAPPFVAVHDLDHLQASVGRWNWGDERYFHMAKIPCAPECQVDYGAQRGVGRRGTSRAQQEMPGARFWITRSGAA